MSDGLEESKLCTNQSAGERVPVGKERVKDWHFN